MAGRQKNTPEKFWARVEKTPTCWLWCGWIAKSGYGYFSVNYKDVRAHRFAWEFCFGPIPADKQLDHLCRVRHCVNPAHLELVTCQENVLRGTGATARNARKTHCKYGHPLSGSNVKIVGKRKGRDCVICRTKSNKLTSAKRKAARRER
jgi:hypothetical protein